MMSRRLILKKLPLAVCILALLLTLPAVTGAFEGLFSADNVIVQNRERIVFAINKSDGTITAVFSANYRGDAKDFGWVIPIPATPKVDISQSQSLDTLDAATYPQYIQPPNECRGLINRQVGEGTGDEVVAGHAEPYDYAIIPNKTPDELMTWLRDNGYRVTDEMIPIIKQYVDEGMEFLAIKLSQSGAFGDLKPVTITYKAEKPTIPVRLIAAAATSSVEITTWIFADSQYVPENYAHPAFDYSHLYALSPITAPFDYGPIGEEKEQKRLQDEYNGLAFVTEYAQSSASLPSDMIQGDPLTENLIAQYPFVTRLTGQISPEQMTLDPIFAPASDALDVSGTVDLNGYVDRLQYWGCSTRSIRDSDAESLLPNHIRDDQFRFDIAYPQNWVVSHFTVADQGEISVLAPDVVSQSDLENFASGKESPPMFAWMRCDSSCDDSALYINKITSSRTQSKSDGMQSDPQIRYDIYDDTYAGISAGILYSVFASDAQWQKDRPLYEAMLSYANTYQYYAHPSLRNTLFLGSQLTHDIDGITNPVYVGYPEGWLEHWDHFAVMSPENTDNNAPIARLLPMTQFTPTDRQTHDVTRQITADNIATQYGLTDQRREMLEKQLAGSCFADIAALAFSEGGREGYIRILGDYVLEASSSAADFAQLDEILRHITDSLTISDQFQSCG